MRQRAALLRTYLFASDILLLDGSSQPDAITRRKMQLWLLDLYQRYKSSILFVTHDIEEALLLADRIYILGSRPAVVRREILWDRGSSGTPKSEKKYWKFWRKRVMEVILKGSMQVITMIGILAPSVDLLIRWKAIPPWPFSPPARVCGY